MLVPLHKIKDAVCEHFGVEDIYFLNGSSKESPLLLRQIFHYLSRELNKNFVTYKEIGSYYSDVSGRSYDHSTVINSHNKIENYLSYDKDLQTQLNQIKKII